MDTCWETQLQSLPPADHSCCPLQKSFFSLVFSQQHDFFMHFMKHRRCIVVVDFFNGNPWNCKGQQNTVCMSVNGEKKKLNYFSILKKKLLNLYAAVWALSQRQNRRCFAKTEIWQKKKKSQQRPRNSYAIIHFCLKNLTSFAKRNKQVFQQFLPRSIFTSNKWSTKLKLLLLCFVLLYFKVYRTIS